MTKEGWTWALNARKWHYFVDKKSLCGRWRVFSDDSLRQVDDSPENCATCKRKLKARKEQVE